LTVPSSLSSIRLPGRVAYRDALDWQRRLARARIQGALERDLLLLLEHEPVVTLGRGSREDTVRVPEGLLAARGIDMVEIERGGDVTYHGPGQLVGYPIIDLKNFRTDLHWYVRRLEEALILALAELGLGAFRAPGLTGVWVGEDGDPESSAVRVASGAARKIASIGVHVSRWVTWHGFALNTTPEPLDSFRLIVPCGIEGVRMTSLGTEGVQVDPSGVDAAVRRGFERAFDVGVDALPPEELHAIIRGAPVTVPNP
jgi:lipoyl(octanoyl) transferase